MDKKESQILISFSEFAKFSTIGSPIGDAIRNIISGNKINTSISTSYWATNAAYKIFGTEAKWDNSYLIKYR